jgi:hypothetical protein
MAEYKAIHAISDVMADVGCNVVESSKKLQKSAEEFYTFTWRRRSNEPKAWVRFKIIKSKAYALKGLGGGILCSWDLADPMSLRKLKEWAYATAPNK